MSGEPPVALTIAGSDSGAGAGIQADLKTMAALGVFATTAVTAITAQNTVTVAAIHRVPATMVDQQIAAVLADLPVAAVKTGMLASVETIEAVSKRAAAGELPNLVVDPVMVASTGRPLLEEEGVDAYRRHLVGHALVVTPNLWEAALLAGIDPAEVTDIEGMARVARHLHALGARWVVVKGGHLPGVGPSEGGASSPAVVPDILFDGQDISVLSGAHVPTANVHGSGCSLSAAIAARLAAGCDVPTAVQEAKAFVTEAIRGGAAWQLGNGHGPLDHLGWSTRK
ncbi:MAG TPA: bifunctional hydroxymethylpyrimidine kinase/phosphomethylpyrimidine kinase [Acidimicrobiales bacterium]|jgi:hydroxymethylpyrimidine/phosphomethylpyrimidine kinase|nr:bifunctional hydroxymethylpyrimidine kinase/phosphomethylpyrimidine kinase [Acidimicrobiales bacterium]